MVAVPVDGSIMLLHREIGQIPYYPNQQRKLDLKLQPNLIKNITLHVRGMAKTSVQAPAVESRFNSHIGPYNLIKNIQVRGSNGVILKSLGAQQLNLLNTLERGGNELVTTPIAIFDHLEARPFSFDVTIPFESWTSFLPERTILNTNEFSELGLYLLWGSAEDVAIDVFTEPQLVLSDVVCDVVALERVPVDMNDELLSRQRMVDTIQNRALSADNQTVAFDLPENTLIKTLLFYVEQTVKYTPEVPPVPGPSKTSAPMPNGVLRARIEDNNGAHVLRELSGKQIESILQSYYGMCDPTTRMWEDMESTTPGEFMGFFGSQKPGVYVFEFDQLHDFSSLYSTIGVNYPKLILDCGILPPSEPGYTFGYRAVLLQRQIITPAGITP